MPLLYKILIEKMLDFPPMRTHLQLNQLHNISSQQMEGAKII